MRADLPSRTVTFLFTDVEGSTRLLHSLGAEGYAEALAEHRRVIREACAVEGGVEVDTQGDAFFFAFPTAPGALAAAGAFTEALAGGPIQVRVGLHTGTPLLTDEGYVGDDVHFAARVASSAHGGQVVLSSVTVAAIGDSSSLLQALSDLGEHRLKDIEHAVSIFQLGSVSFPPLKTISNTNLPRPASSFLGREAELREVLSRIEAGARLVTLTGPGGTGKTRLALEAATSLVSEYKAGVFWVGLAALRDPALVTETIAQTLGAKDELAAHIAEREMLLLLDNLEQVIDAASDLSELLTACPNLTLLVTSRELLRVSGEVEYPVPPLAEPEAVELFCARSQLEPSDEIAELCTRLDSLPLAVELAAARCKALTPAQILERLFGRLDLLKGGRDTDPRQQTLRATIEWSYDLLSREEQELFVRLSVFAGGCTLEASEEVCDGDLDTIQSLVEKSLIRFTPSHAGGRYWMLETIREYARERLEESREAEEARQRHLELFLRMADEAEPELRGPHASEWLDRLEAEHHNLRAALAHAAQQGQDTLYLRLAGALARYWWTRAHLDEGKRWLEDALARPATPPGDRARALRGLGYLAWARGERGLAFACHEEALTLYRESVDSLGTSMSLMNLGVGWREEGDLPRARRFMEEAVSMQRASGDHSAIAHSLGQLGLLALEEGDLDRAAELCEEGLALARSIENDYVAAIILRALAPVALGRGDHANAAEHFRQGLVISRQLGYEGAVASCLKGVAATAAASGDQERAARLLGAASTLDERLHGTSDPPEPPDDALFLSIARSHLGDERLLASWVEGRSIALDEAVALALDETELDA